MVAVSAAKPPKSAVLDFFHCLPTLRADVWWMFVKSSSIHIALLFLWNVLIEMENSATIKDNYCSDVLLRPSLWNFVTSAVAVDFYFLLWLLRVTLIPNANAVALYAYVKDV